MEVLYPRCAGLDVHKDTVVACVRLGAEGTVQAEVRTFDATAPALLSLADWLRGRLETIRTGLETREFQGI
jgi:transposase